ncbi:MAG: fumarate reductase subunit C [Rubrivivax sp.]|nr:fumarate reductase subunit C [Rubrivivax sp.]
MRPAAAPPPARPRAYVRPMRRWWKRDPFFMGYMARELTSLAVFAYAVVLTVGLVSLARGEAAWAAWLQALRSPLSLLLHGVLLVAFFVHAKSWFEIMPKTMPPVRMGRRIVPGRVVTRAGWLAAVVCSALLLLLAWVAAP